MAETNETCPKCGSEYVKNSGWTCGSHLIRSHVEQSSLCLARQSLRERDEQLAAVTKERDELVCAIWILEKPDDATHQEALDHLEWMWKAATRPVSQLLDQSRAIAAATARAEAAEREAERLREGFDEIKEAAWAAHRDIGEWIQLACCQQQASADYTHDPLCATDAGLARSQDVRAQLVGALGKFAALLAQPGEEAGDGT